MTSFPEGPAMSPKVNDNQQISGIRKISSQMMVPAGMVTQPMDKQDHGFGLSRGGPFTGMKCLPLPA